MRFHAVHVEIALEIAVSRLPKAIGREYRVSGGSLHKGAAPRHRVGVLGVHMFQPMREIEVMLGVFCIAKKDQKTLPSLRDKIFGWTEDSTSGGETVCCITSSLFPGVSLSLFGR